MSVNINAQEVAPDFEVTDIHGNTHRLYDYLCEGKYVVVDFLVLGADMPGSSS